MRSGTDIRLTPEALGDQSWDKFTKRELMAIRFAERIIDSIEDWDAHGIEQSIVFSAVDMADAMLRKLSEVKT